MCLRVFLYLYSAFGVIYFQRFLPLKNEERVWVEMLKVLPEFTQFHFIRPSICVRMSLSDSKKTPSTILLIIPNAWLLTISLTKSHALQIVEFHRLFCCVCLFVGSSLCLFVRGRTKLELWLLRDNNILMAFHIHISQDMYGFHVISTWNAFISNLM